MTGTVALRSIDGMHEVSVLFDSRADAEALFCELSSGCVFFDINVSCPDKCSVCKREALQTAIEKHAETLTLEAVLDIVRACGLRLRIELIDK